MPSFGLAVGSLSEASPLEDEKDPRADERRCRMDLMVPSKGVLVLINEFPIWDPSLVKLVSTSESENSCSSDEPSPRHPCAVPEGLDKLAPVKESGGLFL